MKPRWKQMSKSEPKHEHGEEDVYLLIDLIQADPKAAATKERLVLHYEGLVHSLARKYSHNSGNHEDVAQVGMIGLLIAAERFERRIKRSCEAFAILTIMEVIKRLSRDQTWSVAV